MSQLGKSSRAEARECQGHWGQFQVLLQVEGPRGLEREGGERYEKCERCEGLVDLSGSELELCQRKYCSCRDLSFFSVCDVQQVVRRSSLRPPWLSASPPEICDQRFGKQILVLFAWIVCRDYRNILECCGVHKKPRWANNCSLKAKAQVCES